ncbi:hypothetical protein [Plantibacter sp. YIM 135249]
MADPRDIAPGGLVTTAATTRLVETDPYPEAIIPIQPLSNPEA